MIVNYYQIVIVLVDYVDKFIDCIYYYGVQVGIFVIFFDFYCIWCGFIVCGGVVYDMIWCIFMDFLQLVFVYILQQWVFVMVGGFCMFYVVKVDYDVVQCLMFYDGVMDMYLEILKFCL